MLAFGEQLSPLHWGIGVEVIILPVQTGGRRFCRLGHNKLIGNPVRIIQAGESLDFVFELSDCLENGFIYNQRYDNPSSDLSGWICTIEVKRTAGSTPEISRIVPLDNELAWSGYLTSTETASLSNRGSTYRLIANLVNVTTDEQESIVKVFQLNNPW